MNNPPKKQKESLEWVAPEFDYFPKSKNWFLVSSGSAVLLFGWASFSKNFLFAFLIGLAFFSFLVYAFKKPRPVHLAITPKGVSIDQTIYQFENLKSFWIFYDPPRLKEISFHSKKTLMPYLKIPLAEQNPVEARALLIKYLPEKQQEESALENISRHLKF